MSLTPKDVDLMNCRWRLEDYTPSIPDEDLHMTPVRNHASAPDLPGPSAEHEEPEPLASESSGPPRCCSSSTTSSSTCSTRDQ